jgi:hypothetical protein
MKRYYPTIQLTYKFSFGKYQGKTVKEVIEVDPAYLLWADSTIDWFILSDEVSKKVIDIIFEKKMMKQVHHLIYW